MDDRSQRILTGSLVRKLLARWVQERSFTTTSFREPTSPSAKKKWPVHGGQLQIHHNKGQLQGFELQCGRRQRKCHGIQRRVHRRQSGAQRRRRSVLGMAASVNPD